MFLFLVDLLLLDRDVEFPSREQPPSGEIVEAWAIARRAYINDEHLERVESLEEWVRAQSDTNDHSKQIARR